MALRCLGDRSRYDVCGQGDEEAAKDDDGCDEDDGGEEGDDDDYADE